MVVAMVGPATATTNSGWDADSTAGGGRLRALWRRLLRWGVRVTTCNPRVTRL
jgi:hypothetical protein